MFSPLTCYSHADSEVLFSLLIIYILYAFVSVWKDLDVMENVPGMYKQTFNLIAPFKVFILEF